MRATHLTRNSRVAFGCSSRCFFGTTTPTRLEAAELADLRESQRRLRIKLQEEASSLTKLLYRRCLRSIKTIRQGNEHDERNFQEREQEQADPKKMDEDLRLGTFSMLPPVDREDELRSRAEYYHQYAHENICQEADALPRLTDPIPVWREESVDRYVFFVKKGESDRLWLLQDMKFDDPVTDPFPLERLEHFEERAKDFVKENERVEMSQNGVMFFSMEASSANNDDEDDDDEDDGWADDEDKIIQEWMKQNPGKSKRPRKS